MAFVPETKIPRFPIDMYVGPVMRNSDVSVFSNQSPVVVVPVSCETFAFVSNCGQALAPGTGEFVTQNIHRNIGDTNEDGYPGQVFGTAAYVPQVSWSPKRTGVPFVAGDGISVRAGGQQNGPPAAVAWTVPIMKRNSNEWPRNTIFANNGERFAAHTPVTTSGLVMAEGCRLQAIALWSDIAPNTALALTPRINGVSVASGIIRIPAGGGSNRGFMWRPASTSGLHLSPGDRLNFLSDGLPTAAMSANICAILTPEEKALGEGQYAAFSNIPDYTNASRGAHVMAHESGEIVGFWINPQTDPDATSVLTLYINAVAQTPTYTVTAAANVNQGIFYPVGKRTPVAAGSVIELGCDGIQIAGGILSYTIVMRR